MIWACASLVDEPYRRVSVSLSLLGRFRVWVLIRNIRVLNWHYRPINLLRCRTGGHSGSFVWTTNVTPLKEYYSPPTTTRSFTIQTHPSGVICTADTFSYFFEKKLKFNHLMEEKMEVWHCWKRDWKCFGCYKENYGIYYVLHWNSCVTVKHITIYREQLSDICLANAV